MASTMLLVFLWARMSNFARLANTAPLHATQRMCDASKTAFFGMLVFSILSIASASVLLPSGYGPDATKWLSVAIFAVGLVFAVRFDLEAERIKKRIFGW